MEPSARAVLQAGGPGTRMRAVSETLPKHLLPVGGVPMVERLLRQVLAAGVREAWVITGHLGETVEAHLRGLTDLPPGTRLGFIREHTKRGDIGSICEVPAGEGPLIWAYADLVTDLDFGALLQRHRTGGAAITLTSHVERHQVRLGELLAEGERVLHYLEKPWKEFLICSGIAVIEPSVLDLVDPQVPIGLDELVEAAIGRGQEARHWRHGAFWIDVNDADALAKAREALT